MITRSVTVAKIRREYWQQIADGRKRFELRDEEVEYDSNAFVFVDASTGEHLGNARILRHTAFGGYENSHWDWSLLAKLVEVPVAELKQLFPVAVELGNKAYFEYDMHVYEIEPISDDEILHTLLANLPKNRLN